jgi:hypothetical protein
MAYPGARSIMAPLYSRWIVPLLRVRRERTSIAADVCKQYEAVRTREQHVRRASTVRASAQHKRSQYYRYDAYLLQQVDQKLANKR